MKKIIGLLSLNLFFAFNIHAESMICSSTDYKIKLLKEDDCFFISRTLEDGDHSRFDLNKTIKRDKLVLSNFNLQLIFEKKELALQNSAVLNIDGISTKETFLCEEKALTPLAPSQSTFPSEILQHISKNSQSDKQLVYKIKHSFNFELYRESLGSEISEIGDWYEIELNAAQENTIKTFVINNNKNIINLISNYHLNAVGYLFARDWYSGEGTIGIVISNAKELAILPVPFGNSVIFNDSKLDHTY